MAFSLSCRLPTSETCRFDWGATLSKSRCTLMGFNLGFHSLFDASKWKMSPEDAKFILEICEKRLKPCACFLWNLQEWGVETSSEMVSHILQVLWSVSTASPGRRRVPFYHHCSLPPPPFCSHSLPNLFSWYRVTGSLLDSTQNLRALQNSASVLLPVTSAAS